MARSTDVRKVSLLSSFSLFSATVLSSLGGLTAACTGGPSKGQALETIQRDVKEDGSCTLPMAITRQLKMQYSSNGTCVPNEGAANALACIAALESVGITHAKPPAYMVDWEDGATLANVYERHARNLVFKTCVDMDGLREGRFPCAEARADKIVRVRSIDDTHAEVRYARDLAFRPSLTAIEKACGPVTRPTEETTANFVKGDSGWTITPSGDGAGTADGGK